MKRLKVLKGYTAYARFLAETSDDVVGWIPKPAGIPSPYFHSATRAVSLWNGRRFIVMETAHRRYEVFEVPADATVYENENDAANVAIALMAIANK